MLPKEVRKFKNSTCNYKPILSFFVNDFAIKLENAYAVSREELNALQKINDNFTEGTDKERYKYVLEWLQSQIK